MKKSSPVRPLMECRGQYGPVVFVCRHLLKCDVKNAVEVYIEGSGICECPDVLCTDCFHDMTNKKKRIRLHPTCWRCLLKLLVGITLEKAP